MMLEKEARRARGTGPREQTDVVNQRIHHVVF
jgi:hypothetical protein